MSSCPGGGRITHDPENKQIVIFGYSQGFGRADHEVTHKFVQDAFPDYEVAWNNEGYWVNITNLKRSTQL